MRNESAPCFSCTLFGHFQPALSHIPENTWAPASPAFVRLPFIRRLALNACWTVWFF
jgi:hypothetical protein